MIYVVRQSQLYTLVYSNADSASSCKAIMMLVSLDRNAEE